MFEEGPARLNEKQRRRIQSLVAAAEVYLLGGRADDEQDKADVEGEPEEAAVEA